MGDHRLDQEANRGLKEAPVCGGGDGGLGQAVAGARGQDRPPLASRRRPLVAEGWRQTPGMLVHFAPVTGRRGPWMQPLRRRVDPFHGLTTRPSPGVPS